MLKSIALTLSLITSLQATATWYECHTLDNDSKFSFEESSSREINIYSPILIEPIGATIQDTFVMTKLNETTYSANTSESFDYPCNYQGSQLIFDVKNFQIQVIVSCDGASPFAIHNEKVSCTVY